ncbi:hypothetical protein AK812_SmicGene11446 [Symbiodinium microadriaticum]|uniref:Uncharacterized protein n=1 Tax=Symbiodinium microadriaticum TaxID=2951 RepID=A0A1Q9ED70_SYMMI|nr:hypothetical protein AK812_SmicGene11446 [Symbiodinium microadriaticum]
MDAANPLAEQDSGADDGSKDDSLKGLADLWDNIPEVRQRLRKNFNLLVHYDPKLQKMFNVKVEKSTHNVRLNAPVLSPVLKIMKLTNDLPAIDRLMEQVVDVFGRFSLPITESLSNSQSWAIRDMIQVLKKNKNKKAWQQDPVTRQLLLEMGVCQEEADGRLKVVKETSSQEDSLPFLQPTFEDSQPVDTQPEASQPVHDSVAPPEESQPDHDSVAPPEESHPVHDSVAPGEESHPVHDSVAPREESQLVPDSVAPEGLQPVHDSVAPPEDLQPVHDSVAPPEDLQPVHDSVAPEDLQIAPEDPSASEVPPAEVVVSSDEEVAQLACSPAVEAVDPPKVDKNPEETSFPEVIQAKKDSEGKDSASSTGPIEKGSGLRRMKKHLPVDGEGEATPRKPKPKATAKAKAKALASPKSKAKAKAKAKTKASAKCSAKPGGDGDEVHVEPPSKKPKTANRKEDLEEAFKKTFHEFHQLRKPQPLIFRDMNANAYLSNPAGESDKKGKHGHLEKLLAPDGYRYELYWTRSAVGVKRLDGDGEYKQIVYFSRLLCAPPFLGTPTLLAEP